MAVMNKCEHGKYHGLCRICFPVVKTFYASEILEIIEQFRQEQNPPHKEYETYNDGWLDACNEIYWAIKEITE